MDAKDVLLGLGSLLMTAFGTYTQDITSVVVGIVLLFLTIQLNLQDHEEKINTLQAQINTQIELKKIWTRIDYLEKKNGKKK